MQLLTIDDLARDGIERTGVFEAVAKLRDLYLEHAEGEREGADYRVRYGSDEARLSGIHASEIFDCLRASVYSLRGTKRRHNPSDGHMRRRFRIGHAVHAMVQDDFCAVANKSRGRIGFEPEVSVDRALGGPARRWELSTTSDGVFTLFNRWRKPVVRIGLEIKTVSDGVFERLRRPQRQHREQCSVYQAALDLPVMWTLYYNKSNSNISAASPPFVQEFDAPLWLELEERFRVVHEHRERRTLPARREGYHCRWCAFAWTCKPRCLVRKRGQTHFARIGRDSSPRG